MANIKRMSYKEFRDNGLLFYVNQILHGFNVTIVYDPVSDSLYPAYSEFQGFTEEATEEGYEKFTKFLERRYGGRD